MSMKKRSKSEIEIRNILTEFLCDALGDPDGGLKIKLLISALELIVDTDGRETEFDEIAERVNDIWHTQTVREVLYDGLSGLASMELFEESEAKILILKARYERQLPYIIKRLYKYASSLALLPRCGSVGRSTVESIEVGAALFNEGLYFEAHEYLEELWHGAKGREKEFIKALIHLSVALYHMEFLNLKGAFNYLKRTLSALDGFEDGYQGVKVTDLISEIEGFELALSEYSVIESPQQIPRLPKINLI